jgi:hypothetical protein
MEEVEAYCLEKVEAYCLEEVEAYGLAVSNKMLLA